LRDRVILITSLIVLVLKVRSYILSNSFSFVRLFNNKKAGNDLLSHLKGSITRLRQGFGEASQRWTAFTLRLKLRVIRRSWLVI